MKKVSKESWIRVGIDSLAQEGEDVLTIENLCKQLKVSKGSFYHHFSNIDHYLSELFGLWSTENTEEIIQETSRQSSFEEKIEVLNRLVHSKDISLEVRIRAWGIREPAVGKIVANIDEVRTAFLATLYLEKGLPKNEALEMARIEYAAFVGAQLTLSHLPPKEFQKIGNTFQLIIKHYIK